MQTWQLPLPPPLTTLPPPSTPNPPSSHLLPLPLSFPVPDRLALVGNMCGKTGREYADRRVVAYVELRDVSCPGLHLRLRYSALNALDYGNCQGEIWSQFSGTWLRVKGGVDCINEFIEVTVTGILDVLIRPVNKSLWISGMSLLGLWSRYFSLSIFREKPTQAAERLRS